MEENTKITENDLAIEIFRELKTQNKRWCKAFFTILILWFITIAGFLWYINQFDYSTYDICSNDGGNANYIGRDGDINNGESSS